MQSQTRTQNILFLGKEFPFKHRNFMLFIVVFVEQCIRGIPNMALFVEFTSPANETGSLLDLRLTKYLKPKWQLNSSKNGRKYRLMRKAISCLIKRFRKEKITLLRVIPTMTCRVRVVRRMLSTVWNRHCKTHLPSNVGRHSSQWSSIGACCRLS